MSDQPLTPEQIEQRDKRIEEVKRLRLFVKDKLYPAVVDATTSVEDAKMFLTSFSAMMMDVFLEQMKDMKFIDLKLHNKLNKTDPNYKHYIALLALFGNESVFNARELIEGMKSEIEMMIRNEMSDRKLESLKTNFL